MSICTLALIGAVNCPWAIVLAIVIMLVGHGIFAVGVVDGTRGSGMLAISDDP